ncbi:MAG: ABC transporter permease [Pseudobdellovibrionaceae bacterium]
MTNSTQLTWIPFLMLLRREIERFFKVIVQTVVTPFVSSFLYLLVFGVSIGEKISLSSGTSYLMFLIPGLVMMSALNNAFQNSSSSIVSGKFSGDLEDWRVAPLSSQQLVWAISLGGLVRGFVVGSITFFTGFVFCYFQEGTVFQIAHPLELIFFLCVGSLVFSKIGILVSFWARTFDQLSAFSAFILLPLTYLGGVFFSVELLSPFWQTVAKLNPLLYFINGVRHGMLGFSDVNVATAAVISSISLIVFHFAALHSIKKGSFARW